MSEKHEHHSDRPGRRLRLGGVIDALTSRRSRSDTSSEDDRFEALYKERQREELDQRPAGPGLKGYDVDLGLFQYSTDMTELMSRATEFYHTFDVIIDRYHQEGRDVEGQFHYDSEEHPFESFMFSSAAQSRPTERLSSWLKAHVPQNGYFTPEMVLEAVAGNDSISVTHEVVEGVEQWTFSDEEGEHFALSRSTDGSRPSVRTKPYLAVRYSPEYDFDTEEVVAEPKLGSNGYDQHESAAFRGSLGRVVKDSLGVYPVRLSQKIEFNIVDAKPVPYLASADVHSLESITAQAHVIADLPEEAV